MLVLNKQHRRVAPARTRTRTRRSLFASVETLEARLALATTIQLDYTYDNSNYFTNNPAAKTALEQAAKFLGDNMHDKLSAISVGTGSGNTWTAKPFDPRNVGSTLNFVDLTVPADTLIVYVGAYSLGAGILGQGGPGGYSTSGSAAWNTLVATRGQTGVTATPRRDISIWGGSITFNSAASFTYSDINTPPAPGGTDFLGVALHELGHVLGLVPGESEYGYRDLGTNTFNGPRSVATYGGPVPLDPTGKHWAGGTLWNGKRTAMDPVAPQPGQRAMYTGLDWAALGDAGWETDSLKFTSAPPSQVNTGVPFSLTVATQYADGTVDTTYNGPITLSLASGPQGGLLQGTLSKNATNGVATFTGLSLNLPGNNYQIQVNSDANTPALLSSNISAVKLVQATKLVVSTSPPSSTAAGTPFGLTVRAEDAQGNVDTSFIDTVSISLAANPGSATLGGTKTVSAVNGVATFAGLSIDKVASGYTLTASTATLTPATTSTINVTTAQATLGLTSNINGPSYGQSLVFTLNVNGGSGLPAPTGLVQFQVDGQDFGSSVAIVNGAATSPAIASLAVGNHSISATYLGDAIYAQQTKGGLTIPVAKAPLAVTVENKSRSYGTDNPVFTVKYAGLVLGEDASALGGSLNVATSAIKASPPGQYNLAASGLASNNYLITYTDGKLTITPAPLTIQADPKTKTYGDANPSLTATYTGLVLGQTPSDIPGTLLMATSANNASRVGNYSITPSGPFSVNYAITFLSGNLQVQPAPLLVQADDATRQFGADNPAFGWKISGFRNGDLAINLTKPVTVGTSATKTTSVGQVDIVPSGATHPDYAIQFLPGKLTITPAPLLIRPNDQARPYGSSQPLSVGYVGLVDGDSPATWPAQPIITTNATAASPVGSYVLTASGANTPNYVIQYASGQLQITPAVITVKAVDQALAFGAAIPPLAFSLTGFANGENEAVLSAPVSVSTTATSTSPSGTYPIVVSGGSAANYQFSYQAGTLTILPPPLVSVDRFQVQTIRVGRRNTTVIVVTFSGDLDTVAAQTLAGYRLLSAGRDRKSGTRDDKVLALKSAVYNAQARTVTLTTRAALTFAPTVQLRVLGASVRDKVGRLVDGDRDGNSGGDAVATLNKKST